MREFPKISRDENFVLGTDIGTPIDIDLGIAEMLERTVGVEHHHRVSSRVIKAGGQRRLMPEVAG